MSEPRMPDGEPVHKYWERVTLEELDARGYKVSNKEWQQARNWSRTLPPGHGENDPCPGGDHWRNRKSR